MSKAFLFVPAVLALTLSTAFAQQQRPEKDPNADMMRRQQDTYTRQAQNKADQFAEGDRQAWLNASANLAKLRAKLAEAWQGMGLSPQAAKTIADAYDPQMASQMHHTSMRGKSDQEVAALLQSALTAKHYLVANQLLIDYQREKLKLGEMVAGDGHGVANSK